MSEQGGIRRLKLPTSRRYFPQSLKWGLGHPELRGHSGLLRECASEEEHHPARRAVPGTPGLWGATNQPHSRCELSAGAQGTRARVRTPFCDLGHGRVTS